MRQLQMLGQKGFSLLELLIVVAVILILAAIAIPNLLQARISANEASAVGSLQAIKRAEVSYYNTYPTIGYSNNLSSLGGAGEPCVPSSTGACLIDNFLATATPGSGGKSGYVFLATPAATSTVNDSFVAGTSPINVHQTGNIDYCSTEDGVLRSQAANVGDTPVTVPATCVLFPVSQ